MIAFTVHLFSLLLLISVRFASVIFIPFYREIALKLKLKNILVLMHIMQLQAMIV